jgi:nitroreductase/NAD-dependent dihydropyrimidine dehydrogenase PreA subunit
MEKGKEIIKNEETCINCLLCVKECISGVFDVQDNKAVILHPEFCNRCSHCVSVCPVQAIAHGALDLSQVKKVDHTLIQADAYAEIVKARRSIRHYQDQAVFRETIERLLSLSRYSPTASNDQNVEYMVISDKALLGKISKRMFSYILKLDALFSTSLGKRLRGRVKGKILKYLDAVDFYKAEAEKGRDLVFHNAPILVLFLAPAKASFAEANCNIAAANFVNYAFSMGLGTCFIGFLVFALKMDRKIKAWIGVPAGKKVYASVVLGYPEITHRYTPSRKPPKIIWK